MTTDTSTQTLPEISGGKVVYQDYRHGGAEIYCYDLVTGQEKRLTYDPAAQLQPAISGNTVVYEDLRNGDYDIYAYDMATNTEKRLTYRRRQNDWGPSVSGTKVVYHSVRSAGANDIYCYDLSTDTEWRLTTDPGSQAPASIDGNTVAFIDSRFGGQERSARVNSPLLASPQAHPASSSYGARARLSGRSHVLRSPARLEDRAPRDVDRRIGVDRRRLGDDKLRRRLLTHFTRAHIGAVPASQLRRRYKAYLSAQSSARLVKPKVYLTRPSFGRTKLRYRKTYTAKGYLKPRHGAGNTQVKIKAYRYSKASTATRRPTPPRRRTTTATRSTRSASSCRRRASGV